MISLAAVLALSASPSIVAACLAACHPVALTAHHDHGGAALRDACHTCCPGSPTTITVVLHAEKPAPAAASAPAVVVARIEPGIRPMTRGAVASPSRVPPRGPTAAPLVLRI